MTNRVLPRIAARLYTDPWLMRRDMHAQICRQYQTALRRSKPRVLVDMDDDDDHDEPDGDEGPQVNVAKRADNDCLSNLDIDEGVAIVPVHGILGKHLGMLEMMCGGYDLETLNAQCLALMNRADVRTVIFHFNTPGGAAAGVADSAQCMRDLAATGRRLVAYCDEACSGGMWLAAACDEIYAGKSAMVGSISALCAILDESKAFEMEGLKMEVFADGALKGAGVEGTSLTAEQRTDIQKRIEHIGGMFKEFIITRRPKVKPETMQGQWFYGDVGVQVGLVDELVPTLAHCVAGVLARS